ncbi:MAG: hemolysin family protein [Candidatus Omnitrophota bacterium]
MLFSYELIVILFTLIFNAIFSAYEIALASIAQSRVALLVNERKKGASEAAFMKERMEASLAIVQLGTTLMTAIAAAVGGAGVMEGFAPILQNVWGLSKLSAEITALILLIIPLTFFIIVFAELVPKMIALNNKEFVVLKLSPAMKFLMGIAYPVVSLIEVVVKKVLKIITLVRRSNVVNEQTQGLYELKAAVSLARASKLLGAREEKIVLSAAQLTTKSVREIMIPYSDIFMIYEESSLTDAFLKAHLDMHTRFPVCSKENDPQSIYGYINFKDIVAALRFSPAGPSLKSIIRPILRLDENVSLSLVLEKMMQDKTHIAIVISSEKDNVLGMITMEDIVEELVGEIGDEFDRLPTHIFPYGTSWIMGGGIPITQAVSILGLDWSDKYMQGRIPTLQEWCVEKIGKPLLGGELIEKDNIRVIPRKFRRKKMFEAVVSLN